MSKSLRFRADDTSNPFGSAKEGKRKGKGLKRVDMGIAGQTPKKLIAPQQTYTEPEPSSSSAQTPLSPERDSLGFDRPKTSRGKSHPSPDEFFNYVIPSPVHSSAGPSRLVIRSSSSEEEEQAQALELDDRGVRRERQVTLLACWLFGSIMRV